MRTHYAGLLACMWSIVGCTFERTNDAPRVSASVADSVPAANNSLDLLRTLSPLDSAGLLTVVIEIPAGTNDKWELNKDTGQLEWEMRNGAPRVIAFLPYPGNYGFVPRTLLPKDAGGDGDPLDVLVLGPALERGTVVSARLLGVLRMKDGGETDDKLIAVLPDSPFAAARSVRDMQSQFPGALDIVSLWFASYKGPGIVSVDDYGERDDALRILNTAIEAFPPL